MQLASKPVASHEHIIFSLKEYKVSLREPWLLWATFLFRLSVPIIGKPLILGFLENRRIAKRATVMLKDFLASRFVSTENFFEASEYITAGEIARKEIYRKLSAAIELYQGLLEEVPTWDYVAAQLGIASERRTLLLDSPNSPLGELGLIGSAQYLDQACTLDPKRTEWRNALAQVLIRLKRFDDALLHLDWVAKHADPQDERMAAVNNIAVIFALKNDLMGARELLESICQFRWICAEVCHNLSLLYRKAGQDDIALVFNDLVAFLKPDYSVMNEKAHNRNRNSPWWWQAQVQPQHDITTEGWQFYLDDPGDWAYRWLIIPDPTAKPETWIAEWQKQTSLARRQLLVLERIYFRIPSEMHSGKPSLKWEYCEIVHELIKVQIGIPRINSRFWAKGIGSNGIYRVAESDVEINGDSPLQSVEKDRLACESLVQTLINEGWEPIDEHGSEWFSYKFRRRVQS